MITVQPRLVVSAPSSGHGKTAIAVGLLAALTARGVPTAGFKVGPDHTDAAYLGLAAGRPGRNLDPRLVGVQRVAPLFLHGAAGAQLAVVEGAMGLFDSLTGQPEIDGTAAVAASLRAPVVLVVDVAAMGHSLAALVHGFRMFDEMVHLGGVILNRVASPRHEQMLRSAMDDIGMPVLGALHRGELPNALPARVHGLVPVADRTVEASRAVRRLGESITGMLDLDRLMALAGSAPALPGPIWTPAEAAGGEAFDQRPVIALAGGQGAPYTYVETAELLTAAGADVAVVDPLRDEALPPGTRGLVVGAGLPEGYAEELSANRRLCAAVAQFARDGGPIVAEGVALPWLGHELDGRPMCGVLDITATTGEQTVAGYREATAPGTSVLAPAGARITGYKQHRAIVAPRAGSSPAWTWSGGNPEGFVWRQVHASQLGLHWAAAPEIAKRLVAAALAGSQGAPPAAVPPSSPMSPAPPNRATPPAPPSPPNRAAPPVQPSPAGPMPAMASASGPGGPYGPASGPGGPHGPASGPGGPHGPGAGLGAPYDSGPGLAPGSGPGAVPGPGPAAGSGPGSGAVSGYDPAATIPGVGQPGHASGPGMASGPGPGMASGPGPGMASGPGPGLPPGFVPDPGYGRDGGPGFGPEGAPGYGREAAGPAGPGYGQQGPHGPYGSQGPHGLPEPHGSHGLPEPHGSHGAGHGPGMVSGPGPDAVPGSVPGMPVEQGYGPGHGGGPGHRPEPGAGGDDDPDIPDGRPTKDLPVRS